MIRTKLVVLSAGLISGLATIACSDPNKVCLGGACEGEGGAGGTPSGAGGGPGGGTMVDGGECPTDLGLPAAAVLVNLTSEVDGNTARIRFDPRAGAKDYRVYEITPGGVKGEMTYRCAGNYAVPKMFVDGEPTPQSYAFSAQTSGTVLYHDRNAAEATLGHVFTTPGDDRVPVYALGDPDLSADNVDCYFQRYPESREKRYTTSEQERTELLAKRWRDDGIAFYAPKPGTAGTAVVHATVIDGAPLYMAEGSEYEKRKADGATLTDAFSVYTSEQAGSEPLMRVFYRGACGGSHDELAAGDARFQKAYHQGPQPVAELHWSGITDGTTLVVEALDDLCPFQGALSPVSRPAGVADGVDYPAFKTLEEMRATSPSGEAFVSGQGDPSAQPHAIARACLKLPPSAAPKMDWSYAGSSLDGEIGSIPGDPAGITIDSADFDIEFHSQATDKWAIGSIFGEIWALHADWAADVGGKLRFTSKTTGTLAADTFLHATMEVDTISTSRRYPQILISDRPAPVQKTLDQGSTVIVQTFGGEAGPTEVQIEFCDHRTWEVNDQCPGWDLYKLDDGNGGQFLSPRVEINGLQGIDRTVQFDVYVSTARVYVYTNGLPYGCVDLPEGRLPAGSATVTYGDALYHSGVDLGDGDGAYSSWYPFHHEHMQVFTSRHYSNLGFSSHVPEPGWDANRIPCVPASKMQVK